MRRLSKLTRISALVLLIAVVATLFVSCGKKEEDKSNESGKITITVEVINKAGEKSKKKITTAADNLADALKEAGMVDGYDSDYGFAITAVNGEVADFNTEGAYWALSKGGEYLMTGASSTPIADGDHFEITYTVYSE